MLSISELRPGVSIKFNNKLYTVTESKHLKLGRGSGMAQVKMRCLQDGSVLQNNFKGSEKVEPANLTRRSCQYLYADNSGAHLMDAKNFEQYLLPKENAPAGLAVVQSGTAVDLVLHDDQPVSVQLPIKVSVEVKSAAPGIQGDRVSAGTKTITLETGAQIQAPLFIKAGDTIVVDTRFASYVERAKR